MLVLNPFRYPALCSLLSLVLLSIPMPGQSLDKGGSEIAIASSEQTPLWESDNAKYLFGLDKMRARSKGVLTITPVGIRFDSGDQHSRIAMTAITSVGIGNERVELWGVPARIARMAIYDNGGLAVAAVLHHVVDLLSIEYRGDAGEYHGAVFVLPKNEATAAASQLANFTPALLSELSQAPVTCPSSIPKSRTITVRPISTEIKAGADVLPPEYRVLLYEHVVDRLEKNSSLDNLYRFDTANSSQPCSEYSAEVIVKSFRKGDNAVRASTGPLGIFIGTTAIAYVLWIRDVDGRIILEKRISSVVRGEAESLDLAGRIAKSIAKTFAALQKSRPEEAGLSKEMPSDLQPATASSLLLSRCSSCRVSPVVESLAHPNAGASLVQPKAEGESQ